MGLIVLVAFIGVPLIEIALFIQVGEQIGLWPTIGTVILTALIGTAMLRAQGLATLGRVQSSMSRGEVPLREVFDGACLLVAGALLLTPGFFTDAIGFVLLVPVFRSALLAFASKRVQVQTMHGQAHSQGFPPHAHPGSQDTHQDSPQTNRGQGVVIDGEFSEVDEPDITPSEPTKESPWNKDSETGLKDGKK